MAAIRKSNLRGKKRWLARDSNPQESNFRGSRFNEHTNLPPLPKSTPEFLSRQKIPNKPSFLSRSNSSVVLSSFSSQRVKPQQINSHPQSRAKSLDSKNRTSKNQKSIPVMPDGSKVPMWLMRWNSIYRHTSVVTFLLVSTTLIVYAWTVYSQHLWSNSYKKLQDLQRDERQLTKHDEILKNRMAQEAEKPNSGLVSPTPANTIFVPETPSSDFQGVDKKSLETESLPSNALGY